MALRNNAIGGTTAPALDRQQPAAIAPEQAAQVGAATLLAVEGKIRAARDELEIVHLIANELRKLISARQVIVLRQSRRGRFQIAAVSSLVLNDRETPFVRWIEGLAYRIQLEQGEREAIEFELPAFVDADDAETRNYPFRHFIWQPISLASGQAFAVLLIARERPWSEQERKVVAREAGVFGSAWQALYGAARLAPKPWSARWFLIAATVAAAVAAGIPVPMTTLATVEIAAKLPQLVTAPIDGVVREILLEPNRPVKQGEIILRFDDTTLRNQLDLAEQEMQLAQAKYDTAMQAALVDDRARRELAEASAELSLREAQRDYAAELLSRSVIRAERSGVLVYTDKDRWIGRPVRTGERILQIVDTDQVIARIEVPVADAFVIAQQASVRLFLDANPLSSIPAHIVNESYHAEPNSIQQLVYRLVAEIDRDAYGLKIGARGTAQLRGRSVPLAFYLLRRPISTIRQHFGF